MIDNYPKFLPQWTKAVEHFTSNTTELPTKYSVVRKYKREYKLDWTEGKCCLTGEAFFHKDAPDETCSDCEDYTYNSSIVLKDLNAFYEFKNNLAEHLQKDHPEIWEQWAEKI